MAPNSRMQPTRKNPRAADARFALRRLRDNVLGMLEPIKVGDPVAFVAKNTSVIYPHDHLV
jgi:hypothetical protein